MKKGFTLVELSIVLVIIGLLIGGILVAQSMIDTAKIQTVVKMLGQFDAAVSNYKTSYGYLPGDNPNICSGCTGNSLIGNGDGMLTDTLPGHDGCVISAWLWGEVGFFWAQLSQAGLMPTGGGTNYTPGGLAPSPASAATLVNTYIPKMPLGTDVGVIACGVAPGENYYTMSNFYLEAGGNGITAVPSLSLTGTEALAIDTKLDDGLPATGQIKGSDVVYNYYGLVQSLFPPAIQNCEYPAGVYNTQATTPVCFLQIRIGINSGDLQ